MPKATDFLRPVVYLTSNAVSLLGVVLVTTGGILWLFLLPSLLKGSAKDPYLGILQFLVLPMVFFAGLALIPVGMWWQKKKGERPAEFPPLDLQNPRFRRLLTFIAVTTAANVVIGGQLTYRAVAYMETVSFCGQTCHTVMKPEFTAYQNSPHSRVECVSCHIGPGANWFVKSKISGSWQVISVTFNLYPRPIPTPIKDLRPARETCEVCHWPQKYGEDRIRVMNNYSDDEQSKETQTVLLVRIGGGRGHTGIHGAHLGPGVRIQYAAEDAKREKIPWVEYSRDGVKREYRADGYKQEGPGNLEVRTMDCIDCHNRPSHTYELPERSVNRALANGEIDVTLPFVRKTAVEALKTEYQTTAESEKGVTEAFIRFYREKHPQVYQAKKAAVEKSANAVLAIYARNIFPEMRVKWGSYPNNLGHTDFPGCFRCHDERKAADGKRIITQDCNTCHQLLAMDEQKPKILEELGLAPQPVAQLRK